jgi:hypothetical protein
LIQAPNAPLATSADVNTADLFRKNIVVPFAGTEKNDVILVHGSVNE